MTRILTAEQIAAKSAANRAAHAKKLDLRPMMREGLAADYGEAAGVAFDKAQKNAPRKVNLLDVGKQSKPAGRPKGKWKPPVPSEHQEQCSVTLWVDFNFPMMGLDPRLYHAIPNAGKRHPAVGAKMKAEGLRKGYPDCAIDIACGGFHGLRLELKAMDGAENEGQGSYHELLRAQGYRVVVCYGHTDAIEEIKSYLATSASR